MTLRLVKSGSLIRLSGEGKAVLLNLGMIFLRGLLRAPFKKNHV